ncbi:MAG: PQQ-dependent sugar dehydrogenase [Bacteroidota bacterium]
MKKYYPFLILLLCVASFPAFSQTVGLGSRMNEMFQRTDLIPAASGLSDPWEVTYGPDDSLWVTEAKGYKVYKVSPVSGAKRMILDISQSSTFLPLADRTFNLQFNFSGKGNPQGGLAGLAIHPDFMNATLPQKYVYVSYIHLYVNTVTTPANGGVIFTNSVVRFHYNTTTGLLENPVTICDTLPGSSDHNSQRMIIAPVNGVKYLFYAQGDMGAGQFGNANRTNNAQNISSYEGKILRFNLEPDGDADPTDEWIPNDNPFNTTSPAKQSAIWSLGIRNNQGFAFANINGVDHLYGSSHGPFSDDEMNIIKRSANYGHPLVIGFSSDGNYDGSGAGSTGTNGVLPIIGSEVTNAAGLANYTDPIYCFYAAAKGTTGGATNTVQRMWYDFNHGSQGNGAWPSEAPSGLDIYTKSIIPGWKNSLLLGSLKGGKVIRLQLNSTGDGVLASPNDTINYFRSTNRFRDMAISPDGNSIFIIIDKSSTTSGPTTGNPIISACGGCVQKYTFLGYAASGSSSTIPTTIPVASGTPNTCEDANTININADNANYWVPITDTNSNVIAEINANGNILGNVTTSLFVNSGAVRQQSGTNGLYLDRNITITPQTQPSTAVSIRLYLTKTEFNALKGATNSSGQSSGVVNPTDLSIYKNANSCGPALVGTASRITTTNQVAFGANGYVVRADISSFSTFYFANTAALLPVHLITFKGSISNDVTKLRWTTEDETGTKSFTIERSTNSRDFYSIGVVQAGNASGVSEYTYPDSVVGKLSSAVVYYRLKMTDADGRFSYSGIVTLYPSTTRGLVTLHPNPVVNVVTIEINAAIAENANWQITDATGKTMLQDKIILTKGDNTMDLNLGKLTAGIYYFKISGNNINQAIKLQKL